METDLRTGQGWKQYCSSLVLMQSPDSQEALSCIDFFKQAIEAASFIFGSPGFGG